jgi:hypothetical protein
LDQVGDFAPPSSTIDIDRPEEFEASGAGAARDYRAFRTRGQRIDLIRLELVTGIMIVAATYCLPSTARISRGSGSKHP